MPAKPAWISDIPRILSDIEALPRPFVDRSTVESLLGVGRRRAQQIMAPCITDRVGPNGLIERDRFIAHLRQLAVGEDGIYEVQRRRKVADVLHELRKDRLERPQLLIEAPTQVLNQDFDGLPEGVTIEVGRITVEFTDPQQALEKLLALAMAISNDFERFEQRITAK